MSNYTPMGFSGDDREDDEPLQKLTAAQIAARDAEWPMFADAHVNDAESDGFDADGSFAHEIYLDGRGDSY